MSGGAPVSYAPASEFRGKGLLVFAAAIGLTTSMNATMFYSLGALIGPMQAEFGWARGDISFSITVMTIGMFLAGPIAGALCDRFGAARVGPLSLIAYATAAIGLTQFVTTLPSLWIAYFCIAVLGAGSTPIVLARPISGAFDRQRGLALGIILTGAGIAGFWVPNLVTEVTTRFGWRSAFMALAMLATLAAPLVWYAFRGAENTARPVAGTTAAVQSGLSAAQARRTPAFWLVSALAVTMALGIGGIVVHLLPLLQDAGASATSAARITSLIGISSVCGRLLIGLCLDRFPTSLVAVTVIVLGTSGVALLGVGGLAFAVPAVILIGLLLGAEVDLLAYLTAKLFGQRAYGSIYGWFYSMYALGYGLSPFLIGRSRDALGSYDVALVASIVAMGAAATIALGLGRKPPVQAAGDSSPARIMSA